MPMEMRVVLVSDPNLVEPIVPLFEVTLVQLVPAFSLDRATESTKVSVSSDRPTTKDPYPKASESTRSTNR